MRLVFSGPGIRRAFLRAMLLALLAAAAWGEGQALAQTPTPGPADDPAIRQRAKDFLDLVHVGEMLSQSCLPEHALAMFARAHNDSVNFPLTDVRLRIEAAYALFLLKKRVNEMMGRTPAQIAQRGLNRMPPLEAAVLSATREGVKRTDDPDVRSLGHIASIYGHIVAGQLAAATGEVADAYRDAQISSLTRTGDCFLAKGHLEAIQGQFSEAKTSARKALECYTQAGDGLSRIETIMFMNTLVVPTPSRTAPKRSPEVALPDDVAEGPLLDVRLIASRAPEMLTGLVASARRHEYRKGANQVLTLLVLKRFAPGRTELQQALRTHRINDAEMLAYLGYFLQLQGYAAPARLLVDFSERAAAEEIQPLAKARYDWIAGKYWRVSGDSMTAMSRFDHADKMLEKVAPPPDLAVGLPEERGLTFLHMGQPGPARRVLEEALTLARSLQQAEDAARLERYIEKIDKGETNLTEIAAPPVGIEQRKKNEAWAALAFSGPRVFQSPFVSDYPPDKNVKSEAQAVAAAAGKLKRPTPSPVPYKESEGRIDILIRTRQWVKATPILEQKIAREGESVDTLMLLGQCYFNRLKWEQAVETFEKVLKLDPGNSGAQGYLDVAREKVKK